MIARRVTLGIVALSLVAATACSFLKKKEPPPADSAPVPTAAPLTEADVPTSEDFEDEAFTKITGQNFTSELSELKKEIEAK